MSHFKINAQTLEQLLSERDNANNYHIADKIAKPPTVAKQKADEEADLDKLMIMINKLVTKTMKKDKVEFCPDEGARPIADPAKKIDHPYIFYDIVSSIPATELKPRIRETFAEDSEDNRTGIIYGQTFDAIVQFNIVACDYLTATKVMKALEELLFIYTAYFKQRGVSELIFSQRFTDKNWDMYRQSCSVRTLQYRVRYEKHHILYDVNTADVFIK